MLKRMYLKKILISSLALFSFFLVYFIPNNKSNEFKYKQHLEYVDKEIKTHEIYLLDKDNYVAKTEIIIQSDDTKDIAKELISAMIIGGSTEDKIPNGFKAIIPSNTKILGIDYTENVLKINFSEELLDTNKDNEEKIIEAIIYTLTSINEVDKIVILIDSKILTELPQSQITLPTTLDRSFGINKQYDLNSDKNINKTTIYYINKFNNQEYYVPVTKINNDQRDKIEIIIDELGSKNQYSTNLMSYLNDNTKILSVNEENNTLTVDFNNYIFNDLDNKDILEEVIYTIYLSIQDNYNVKDVVFTYDNQEIYKNVSKVLE
ncbi:MAG: GerMN domain-containing protein [Bacilli bacterium]|nr:GerMN domain-containing protein [Bacilli bacterium]